MNPVKRVTTRRLLPRAIHRMGLALTGLWIAMSPPVADAHHAGTMFDSTREVSYEGKVVEYKWANPHVFVILDVPSKGGMTKRYAFECPSPSTLRRDGWTFKSLKPGDQIKVTAHPIRDGRPVGKLLDVTFPDGRKLEQEWTKSTPSRVSRTPERH